LVSGAFYASRVKQVKEMLAVLRAAVAPQF
jgi:hypothetical protein